MGFMEIILRDDVSNLGKSGDILKVRNGYGRNYLVPKGLAIVATKKNKAKLEHDRQVITARRSKLIKTSEDMKARLEELTITIQKKVGESDKLFGSVTQREVIEALGSQGVTLNKKSLLMDEPLKTLGVHSISVKLDAEVEATLKVWVVSE
ncbi:MAG: 50S ribosomal protein L9 [Deltaproteobacteria bacterium]|nr:50S ribosomal protein L9 [Deltaproteobacteria bacterium]